MARRGSVTMRFLITTIRNVRANASAPQAKKRGGRASRDKGNRLERAVVRLLQDHGLAGERVPLSGAARGSYCGDLTVPVLGRDLVIEAKVRGDGFKQIYAWIEDRDALIIKGDRRDALVVLPLRLAALIAAAAERASHEHAPRLRS